MKISFFSPICQNPEAPIQEKLGFLHAATHFFDFGQKAYKIQTIDSSLIYLRAINRKKPYWLAVAMRIVLIFTVIIPAFCLVAIAVYRTVNRFQKEPGLKILNLELLHKALNIYCPRLGLVDFGSDSIFRKSTYPFGHRRFAKNRSRSKSANLGPNGVLQKPQ